MMTPCIGSCLFACMLTFTMLDYCVYAGTTTSQEESVTTTTFPTITSLPAGDIDNFTDPNMTTDSYTSVSDTTQSLETTPSQETTNGDTTATLKVTTTHKVTTTTNVATTTTDDETTVVKTTDTGSPPSTGDPFPTLEVVIGVLSFIILALIIALVVLIILWPSSTTTKYDPGNDSLAMAEVNGTPNINVQLITVDERTPSDGDSGSVSEEENTYVVNKGYMIGSLNDMQKLGNPLYDSPPNILSGEAQEVKVDTEISKGDGKEEEDNNCKCDDDQEKDEKEEEEEEEEGEEEGESNHNHELDATDENDGNDIKTSASSASLNTFPACEENPYILADPSSSSQLQQLGSKPEYHVHFLEDGKETNVSHHINQGFVNHAGRSSNTGDENPYVSMK